MALLRTPLIAANWKMHKTRAEAQAFVKSFLPAVAAVAGVEIALAPPFTALDVVSEALGSSDVKLAAQDMHPEPQGAFTGEISPMMLHELGCEYVILGHSERRAHFHEDDAFISKKLQAAYEHDLTPILCVGETLEQRRAGETEAVLEGQLRADLDGLAPGRVARLVVAYEPIWAIGTGGTAAPDDAEAGARFIRELVAELYDRETAESLRVQYGGSVKPANAYELMSQRNVDGALVGGASLDPNSFAWIVKESAAAKP